MFRQIFIVALAAVMPMTVMAGEKSFFNLKLATKSEAQKYIMLKDRFTEQLNQFDIDSRLNRTGGTRAELETLQKNECRDFTKAEQDSIVKSFDILESNMKAAGFNIPVPKEIVIIKTTMHEEGDAGAYTRDNKIYVGESVLTLPAKRLAGLMAHELFHVLTRNCIPFKRAVYTTIGFVVMDNEINFQKDILDSRISNPDVNRFDSFGYFDIKGKTYPCAMMIYTNKPYKGGSFFEYLNIGLIPLDAQHNPLTENGKTVIFSTKDASDFSSQLGENTGYVINPEECLADNFSFVLTNTTSVKSKPLPNMDLINRIKAVLNQKW